MLKRFLLELTVLPRWIIVVIDLVINALSLTIGYLLRFNFDLAQVLQFHFSAAVLCSVVSSLVSTLITKSYAGIVRYTGIEDGKRIATSTMAGTLLLALVNLIYYYNQGNNLVPYSVLVISFPISFFFLFFYRLFVKELFAFVKSSDRHTEKVAVLLFGAGTLGLSVKQMIESTPNSGLRLVALLEDDSNKVGKKIQGMRIYHSEAMERLVNQHQVKEVIVAINNLPGDRKARLVEDCLRLHLKVRVVPPMDRWIKGELSLRQIKEVNIEDLLGRDEISINNPVLVEEIAGKSICITGAAGSIGSELARQIGAMRPSKLILIDQAETPLFNIEMELRKYRPETEIVVCVCDVKQKNRIEKIFEENRPAIVFHAAAYKHVPLMEANPSEALRCNVFGTRIVADVSVKYSVKKFVMISTDKAVNPTSVMGCSKRIAEIYVQSLNNHLEQLGKPHTLFVTTRFGNVLGSNGSVVPIFRHQIEVGGPITVTHPDVVRYFMTIPEACHLVLEAGVMGNGGEIFIFDMGAPVRIYDLARNMVQLSGLELGKDIDIVFTGLRDGEKLYEELLATSENTVPTHHQKIMKATVAEYGYNQIVNFLDIMDDVMEDKNELKVVALMKDIVPEYKSAVSRFQALDS